VVDIFNVIRKGQQRCGLWLPVLQQCHADFVGDAALCQVYLDRLLNQAVSSYTGNLMQILEISWNLVDAPRKCYN